MNKLIKCIRFIGILFLAIAITVTSVGCKRIIEQAPVYSNVIEYIPIDSEDASFDESVSDDASTGSNNDDTNSDEDYNFNQGENDNLSIDLEDYGSLENGIMVYTVEEFGAVGDGKIDDGVAVNDAILAAKQYINKNKDKKAIVRFGKGKIYFCETQNLANATSEGVIDVSGTRDITLEGNGSTIIGVPNKNYISIINSSNIKMSGFNFTYDTPVACRAKAINRISDMEVIFEVPSWYVKAVEKYGKNSISSLTYAIPANNKRSHSYISSIEKVDSTHCKIKFRNFSANGWCEIRTAEELQGIDNKNLTNYVDIPTPGYSHIGVSFSFRGNYGIVEMEKCNIWNAAQFVYQITGNYGNIKLKNINLAPKDSGACPTVAWRDCVHAKDNRGPLTINNCNFKGTHDDLFNISNTMLRVDYVNGRTLDLYGLDYNGAFYPIKVGDTVVAFNPSTDKYYGVAKVESVVVQNTNNIQIKLDKDIGVEKGARLSFKEWACPGTTINGGNFSGSVRIRASGTKITNANFSLIHMWTAYEGVLGPNEGPIPENIIYKNCTFKAANGDTSGTRMTFNCALLDSSIAKSYSVKNIVFDGCKFSYNDIIDRYNSEVIIINESFVNDIE